MPKYSVFEIQLLLETMAYKAGAEAFDKGGFDTISAQMDPKESPYEIDITSRYLKEQIYDRVQKAMHDKQKVINFSQSYIDTLSAFLNFQSFHSFQRSVDGLQKALSKVSFKSNATYQFLIISHPDDHPKLEEISQLIARAGNNAFWVDFRDKELLKQKLGESSIAIVVLSNNLSISAVEKDLPDKAASPEIPIFLYDQETQKLPIDQTLPSEWQVKPILNQYNLAIALSLFKIHSEGKLTHEPDTTPKAQHLNPTESGTIITGANTRIKGKYISGRDMHINIQKKTKDN